MGDSVFDKERKRRNKEINRRLAMTKLYLVDTTTGERFLLAEPNPYIDDGWALAMDQTSIDNWLVNRDVAASHGIENTTLILKKESVND
jgi:hypothetical protein